MNIYCIPHAGASAAVFNKFKNILGDKIDIIPLELPGRGQKSNEDLKQSIIKMVESIYKEFKKLICDKKCMLSGDIVWEP